MQEKKRNAYIDIVKAFAIVCVVFGHCIQYGSGYIFTSKGMFFENTIFKIIYSFHMPLFMLISGYLFAFSVNKMDWKTLIYHKIKTLVVPICLWSIIPFVEFILKNYKTLTAFLVLKKVISIPLTNLWFLWAVFWCSIIVIIVRKCFRDNIMIYL